MHLLQLLLLLAVEELLLLQEEQILVTQQKEEAQLPSAPSCSGSLALLGSGSAGHQLLAVVFEPAWPPTDS